MGSLLSREPETGVANLSELVGVAHALEAESAHRYELLAGEMDRLGAHDTAAVFRALRDEERKHIDAVARWAERLGESMPPAAPFVWRLPPDLASSWEEIAGSALLTPYRALAIAVTNEERAFAYYSYIAAHADDPRIAKAAEEMAQEELHHAMHLRQFRRRAYHQHRNDRADLPQQTASTLPEFLEQVLEFRQEAAREHIAIAAELHRLGDMVSTALIADLARQEIQSSKHGAALLSANERTSTSPVELLHQAKAPLERLADYCENVAAKAPSESLLEAAQKTLSETIATLSRIALRAEQLE